MPARRADRLRVEHVACDNLGVDPDPPDEAQRIARHATNAVPSLLEWTQ